MMKGVDEHSFGIVPLRQSQEVWEVLLVQHLKGLHYGFPKGHALQGESPEQTAERELLEETGLAIAKWMPNLIFQESYTFLAQGRQIHKGVVYFAAEVVGSLCLQESEICQAVWVSLKEASAVLTFPESREIVVRLNSLFDRS